jgi:uncharacterized protein (TIGR00255 family)
MESMTGFGRAETTLANTQYTIEIKSVNHRFLDIRMRLPPVLSAWEVAMTEVLRSRFERGAFEVNIKTKVPSQATAVSTGTRFVIDEKAAKSLAEGCEWLRKNLKVEGALSPDIFALSTKVFVAIEDNVDSQIVWNELKPTYDAALTDLKKMRQQEGMRLKKILKDTLSEITDRLKIIGALAPEQPKKIREKLTIRIGQMQLGSEIDPSRLEWEVALLAERADITEEIDRLTMHLKQLDSLFENAKSSGRKVDFLIQELHREVNTIGSKASLIEITQSVVELKAAIEKLREQVQNVE